MSQVATPAAAAPQRRPARSRRRPDRRGRGPAPEPREILAAPGHPLEPGVRRELEARLGHDFSRVRIHADRDAAALTDLLGADAVAVGRDLFFAAHAYRPETADGLRLLTHELLHTVQVPDGGSRLRVSRDAAAGIGALSVPHEPLEREAEAVAQASTGTTTPSAGGPEPDAVAERTTASASWLRYATVNAEQRRAEQLDPATLLDRVVAGLLRSMRGDPADSSHRVRLQLVRLGPELRATVLERLQTRLPSAEYRHVTELVTEAAESYDGGTITSSDTPDVVLSEDENVERDRERSDRNRAEPPSTPDRSTPDRSTPDRSTPDRTDLGAGARATGDRRSTLDHPEPDETDRAAGDWEQPAGAAERPAGGEQQPSAEAGRTDQPVPADAAGATEEERKRQFGADEAATNERKKKEKQKAEADQQADAERGADRETASGPPAGPGGPEAAAGAVGAAARTPGAAGGVPAAGAAAVTGGGPPLGAGPVGAGDIGGTEPVMAEAVDQAATDEASPLVRHGVLERPGRPEEARPEELPLGIEPGATEEIVPPEPEGEPAAGDADRETGPPPDLLPKTDLDLSAVPTADEELTLPASGQPPSPKPVPTFPAPPKLEPEAEAELAAEAADTPSTRASAERDEDAEDRRTMEAFDAPIAEPAPTDGTGPDTDTREPAAGPAALQLTAASAGPGRSAAAMPAADADFGPIPMGSDAAAFDATDPGSEGGPDLAGPGDLAADDSASAATELPADASVEAGGGECGGAPAPATEPEGAAACGAGGGAPTAPPAAPEPELPDVSGQEPETGLRMTAQLPPDQMETALTGVNGSVNQTVSARKTDLQNSPPQLNRPTGAPETLHGPPQVSDPGAYPTDKVAKVRPARPGQTPHVQGGEEPGGENPADQVETPGFLQSAKALLGMVFGSVEGKLQGAVRSMPTRDPALNTTVGTPGTVPLKDDTDPALTGQQRDKLEATGAELRTAGKHDAAQPLGEHQIFPDVPHEVMRARVTAGASVAGPGAPGGAGPGAAAGPGGGPQRTAMGIIARQERGKQIDASFGQGSGQMTAERQTSEAASQQARDEHSQAVAAEIEGNTAAQAGERGQALTDVTDARMQWNGEQEGHLTTLRGRSGEKATQVGREIEGHRDRADTEASRKTTEENGKIDQHRQTAEREAEQQREGGQKESGTWVSRAWNWIKDQFNKIKNAIKDAFNRARAAVTTIIRDYKAAVFELIDDARNQIINAINGLADALILLGDVALAAFPGLRDKWRDSINRRRDAAIKKVNEYADQLKKTIGDLLDKLGAALLMALDLLEAGLLAAVELVEAAVQAAMKYVEGLISLVGQWAALVADIAKNPGGWLGNLGTAAKEGVQHYLWGALKTAVRQWFNQKVESVLSVGRLLWDVLIKGCMSVAQIGKMAWQAVLAALPMMIIMLVIEKLVSLIVPAAGAIITIIQGLMAAWGTVSRIIAAFQTFFAFLKSVKDGGARAACLFAQTVAAGAVALLEFIANYLLQRLGKALQKVGKKLKGLAQKIMKRLRKGGPGKRRAGGRAVTAARDDLRRGTADSYRGVHRATGRGAADSYRGVHRAGGRGDRPRRPGDRTRSPRRSPRDLLAAARQRAAAAARRAANTARRLGDRIRRSPIGRALTNSARRVSDWYKRQHDRFTDRRNRNKKQDRDHDKKMQQESKEGRLARIVARIRPRLQGPLKRGLGRRMHAAALLGMRLWTRLSGLWIDGQRTFSDRARINPERLVINGTSLPPEPILQFIRSVEADLRHQARAMFNDRQLETSRQPGRAEEIHVPADLDMTLAGESLRDLTGGPRQFRLVNLEGAAGGRLSLFNINKFGKKAGLILKRITGSSASESYVASESRIARSGQVAEAAEALAGFHETRTRGNDPGTGDVALLGVLAHDIEPRRNIGTGILSILLTDFYGQIPSVVGRRRQILELIRTFRRQTMRAAGSVAGAAELNRYLAKPAGKLEKDIAKRTNKLKAGGAPSAMVEGPDIRVRDIRLWQRWSSRVREGRQADEKRRQLAREQGQSAHVVRSRADTPMFRSLETLSKQQDAQDLANREIALIRAWWNTFTLIDHDSYGSAERTRRALFVRILDRIQRACPWWEPSLDVRRRVE